MEQIAKSGGGRKWYENYLPFVAKSQEMQLEWLVGKLARLKNSVDRGDIGLLSCKELKPYISLLLEGVTDGSTTEESAGYKSILGVLLGKVAESDLVMMVECAEIYDIPKLFGVLREISKEQAVLAMKKVPPLYEKSPLLKIDRVFHAIKEKSTGLLEDAAEEIMGSEDVPERFVVNYERFREIMMDEHILGLLYPKAN